MSDANAELDDIRQRVEAILAADDDDSDPETAHWNQDRLYVDVLKAAVDGHPHHMQMAREALRLAESGGTRWYA